MDTLFRETVETFAEGIGGNVQWDGDPTIAVAGTVEWFQKEIQRAIHVSVDPVSKSYTVVAFASRVKKGQRLGRKQLIASIEPDRDLMEVLEEGKALAQSFMEKTFVPWETLTHA